MSNIIDQKTRKMINVLKPGESLVLYICHKTAKKELKNDKCNIGIRKIDDNSCVVFGVKPKKSIDGSSLKKSISELSVFDSVLVPGDVYSIDYVRNFISSINRKPSSGNFRLSVRKTKGGCRIYGNVIELINKAESIEELETIETDFERFVHFKKLTFIDSSNVEIKNHTAYDSDGFKRLGPVENDSSMNDEIV